MNRSHDGVARCLVAVFALLLPFAVSSARGAPAAAPPGAPAEAPAPRDSSRAADAPADTLSRPVLSGVWVLDDKASEDPRPAFQAVLAEIGFGERGAGGAGGSRGPGGADAGGRGGRAGRGTFGSGEGQDRRDPNWRGAGAGNRPGQAGDDPDEGGSGAYGGDWDESGPSGGGASFGGDKEVDPAQRRTEVAARMGDAWQRLLISHNGADLEIVDAGDQTHTYVIDGKWHERRGGRGSSNVNARWERGAVVILIQQKGRFGMTETYQIDPRERRLNVTLRLEPPSGADRLVRLIYAPPQ